VNEYIASVVSSIVVGGGVSALIVFAMKTWIGEKMKASIQHEYNLQIEHYKTKIKIEADAQLESLKSELNRTNTEHQIRFGQLQSKIAERPYGILSRGEAGKSSVCGGT
jgi:3-phosphoglycerate kinase